MTYSENKFREYLKKVFSQDVYIKKLPDKKQTGISTIFGIPDYIVIYDGKTYWFEVKQVKNQRYNVHTFNYNEISNNQYIEFNKMANAGAEIYIAIYLNKELYIISYSNIQFAKFIAGEISVHKTILEKWRIKWDKP